MTGNSVGLSKKWKAFFFATGFAVLIMELLIVSVKYSIFLVGFGICGALLLFLLIQEREFLVEARVPPKLSLIPALAYLISSILILLIALGWLQLSLSVVPAIICTSLLPGHFLLESSKTRLGIVEKVVFSHILSFISTALISLFLLLIKEPLRPTILASTYLLIAFIFLSLKLKESRKDSLQKKDMLHVLALTLSISFPLCLMSFIYPRVACLRNIDISRHYMLSITLSKAPNLYPQLDQLFFHLYEAALLYLSKSSYEITQSILAITGLTVILSFFLMAKSLCRKVKFAHASTIMWSAFSGLGWLYLIKRVTPGVLTPEILKEASLATYYDISFGNSSWIFLWFRPITMAYIFLFALVYIATSYDEFKTKYILPVMVASLYFIHLPELIIFVVSTSFLELIEARTIYTRKETIRSPLIGVLGGFLSYVSLDFLFQIETRIDVILGTLLMMLVMFVAFISLRERKIELSSKKSNLLARWILLVYIWGFIAWLFLGDKQTGEALLESHYVSLFYYPVFLGAVGLFFLMSANSNSTRASKSVFPYILAATALVFGKTLSVLRAEYAWLGYAERRVIPLVFASACLEAPSSLERVYKKLKDRHREGFAFLFLFLLFAFSIGSNFCLVRYYNEASDKLSCEEIYVLNKVRNIYERNPNSTFYAVTYKTLSSLDHAQRPLGDLCFPFVSRSEARPFAFVTKHEKPIPWPYLWAAKRPEIPLYLLLSGDEPYIYLNKGDLATERYYGESFIFSYLLKALPAVIRSPNIVVYPLFQGTTPSAYSKSAVLFSTNSEDHGFYTMCTLLSLLSHNYTTRLSSDPDIDEVNTIFLEDPYEYKIVEKCLDLVRKGKTALVFGLRRYGYLSDLFFKWPIFIESKGGCIHLMENYSQEVSKAEAQFRGNSIELILDNDGGESLVLADDSQAGFWDASGIGLGVLAVPVLSDVKEAISGRNALKIEVREGIEGESNFAQWQISHVFDVPQNWSSYDFLTFYWYGHGDGKRYVLILLSPGKKNFFFYQFEDDWKGWRKVILPLKLPEGLHKVSNIKIWKGSVGNPSLEKINKLLLKLSPQNPNLTGTWFLDRMILEKGTLLSIKVSLPRNILNCSNTCSIKVFAFNRTEPSYDMLFSLDLDNFNVTTFYQPIEDIAFLDGSSSKLFFTENVGISRVYIEEGTPVIDIEIKMPPDDGLDSEDFGVSQCRLLITANMPLNATKLTIDGRKQDLDEKLEFQRILADEEAEILADYWSEDGTCPLAAKHGIGNGTIIYLNLKPIFSQLPLDEALKITSKVMEGLILHYEEQGKGKVKYEKVLLFKSLSAEGLVNVTSRFISMSSQNISAEIMLGDEKILEELESLDVSGDRVVIQAEEAKIQGGAGFYTLLEARNPRITVETKSGKRSLIKIHTFTNGKEQEVEFREETMHVKVFGKAEFYVFRPELEVSGTIFLENAWAYYPLYWRLRTQGQNLTLDGNAIIEVHLSDTYSLSSGLEWKGSVRREPPVLEWKPLVLREVLVLALATTTLLLLRKIDGLLRN